MPLTVQTPTQIVANLQNGITAYTTKVKNFTSGSIAGAVVNSFAAMVLFLQQLAQYLVTVSRAATSAGADLTSFVADYYLTPTRVAATFAQGPLTFARFQAAPAQVVIPVGTIIQNKVLPPAASIQYQVIADISNTNFNASLNGYPIAQGGTSVAVTVQALIAGSASNVQAGSLISINSTNVPADSVVQSFAIQNGFDTETDAALRVRFQAYISSLAKATAASVKSAILSTQPGLTFTINDGLNAAGSIQSAFFTIVADDGSAAIPPNTLTTISNAVTLVRAAGVSFTAIAPTNATITVALTGTTIQPAFNATTVRAAVQLAIIAYINANGVGGANVTNAYVPSGILPVAGLQAVIASFIGAVAGQGLVGYTSLTLNGSTANVALTNYQLANATTGSVTVS